MKRRFAAAVLMAGAALGGCARDRTPAAADTITILHPGDERLLGPYWDMARGAVGALGRLDMPFTFLYPQVHTFVAHRRIAGLSTPHRADPVRYLEFLWLEDRP